jgi:hypothetical protein
MSVSLDYLPPSRRIGLRAEVFTFMNDWQVARACKMRYRFRWLRRFPL